MVFIMVKFNLVELENFRCHENISIPLSSQGLVKIEGSNGAGKSSIFEGLLWILFGENIKKDSIDSIISYGKNYAFGRVLFDVNSESYAIERYRNHPENGNKVIVFTKDDMLDFKNIADGNTHIEQILGIDKGLFQQTVYLTQYNAYSFADDTDSGKKKFLDSLFDLSIFKETEEVLKKNLKELDTHLTLYDHCLDTLNQKIESCKQRVEDLNNAAEGINESELLSEKDNKEAEVKEYKSNIKELTEKVKGKEAEKKEAEDQLPEYENILNELEEELVEVASDSEIREKQRLVNDKRCYVCYNKIDNEQIKKFKEFIDTQHKNKEHNNEVRQHINEAQSQRRKLAEKVSQLNFEIKSINDTIKREKEKLEKSEESLRRWSEYVEQQSSKKERFTEQAKQQEELLVQLESKRETEQPFNEESVHDRQILQIILNAFGKDGIRNDFFDKYISVLESEINQVLQVLFSQMGVPVRLELSTFSKRKSGDIVRKFSCDFYRGKDKYDYKSFSGGERKRIDIAVVMAMQRVAELLGRFKTNILIFDEVFDQLDSEGIDTVINYLREYNKDSIFMISHNDLAQDVDSIISL